MNNIIFERIVRPWARAYTASMSEEPAAGASQASPADLNADCPRCLKPQALCVCAGIAPIDNKVSLLILQHPQEQDRELGTARLTAIDIVKTNSFNIKLATTPVVLSDGFHDLDAEGDNALLKVDGGLNVNGSFP